MADSIEFSSIPSYYNSPCWYSKEEMDVPISQIHSEMKQQPSNIPSSEMINWSGILKNSQNIWRGYWYSPAPLIISKRRDGQMYDTVIRHWLSLSGARTLDVASEEKFNENKIWKFLIDWEEFCQPSRVDLLGVSVVQWFTSYQYIFCADADSASVRSRYIFIV